jgi:hypothetical protein
MKLPISGRMKASREFADLAFFLPILRRSGLHVFGHGSAPLSFSNTSTFYFNTNEERSTSVNPAHPPDADEPLAL